jgi:hypothetical protein
MNPPGFRRSMSLFAMRFGAGAHYVGQVFLRAPFGKESRAKLIAPAGYSRHFDFRIFFLKIRQHGLITADVNRDLAFPLGRFKRFLPFFLPSIFRRDRW